MDWKIISEVTPTDVYTGKLWWKPSTRQAYIRLGSSWLPVASSVDTLTFKRLTLLINGIDKTDYLETGSLAIEDILTQEVDTCSFILIDSTGTNKPEVGQEILIYYKEVDDDSTPILRFGGRIDELPQMQYANGKYSYEVTCTDYTQGLNKNLVVETYTSQTAGYIIKDLVRIYALELGTYHVQDGLTVDYISFNYKFPMDCITELARLTGYDWYVDYEKNIHFFSPKTNTAPYELTESAGSGEYLGLEIAVNKLELKNRQSVRGGIEFSDLYTQEQYGDNLRLDFPFRYNPFAPIAVYTDIGAGYVARTLGIDNIDTGKDFVYNVNQKLIKNQDHAVLNTTHKIKLTYKYKKPILAQQDDETSIALMKDREGGNGVYEAPLISDDTIETKDQARARGQAELDQYSNPLVEGTFITTQYGYRSGQLLTINIPSRNENAQYLIQSVSAVSLGIGRFEYEITFATRLKGLTEFLLSLYDSGRDISKRTDEILDRLKVMEDETVTLTDSGLSKSLRNTTTDAYVYSNDAGTTPDKGQYNLASYG